MTTVIAPVTKTLVLSCTPERAVAVFTEEIETWWPLVHRGWERWGEQAEAYRNGYDGAWVGVLERFEKVAAS